MTDAKQALADARATLKRLENVEEEFAEQNALRDMRFVPLKREPPVRRNHDAEWNAWCRGIVEEVVGDLAEEAGAAVGEVERALSERIELLEQRVGELAAESYVRNSAEVFDLPDWRRKRGDAA